MTAKLLRPAAFDAATLHFGPLEKTRRGSNIVIVSPSADAINERIRLQTPTLYCPFGVHANTDPKSNEIQSYTLDVSFKGHDSNAEIIEFMGGMQKLDEVLLATAHDRAKEWFGPKVDKNAISAFLRRLIQDRGNLDRNGNPYPPTMKVKIPIMNGSVTALFYDENKKQMDFDAFVAAAKGCHIKMIMELSSVWFIGKNMFGVTWRLSQALIVSRPNKLDGFSFLEDDGDEGAEASQAIGGVEAGDPIVAP